MLRVGLTGGIGAGKSTVATRLAEHGAVLIDADRIAREVVEPGTPALEEIVEAFGADVLAADGTLDRPALAAKAFADDEARKKLNAIVHPRVGARTAELLAQARPDAIVVHDVPLLVEAGLAPGYHLVIVVDAPEEIRIDRLVRSRGMDEADARARIAAQATTERRRAVADVWLDNSGTQDVVEAEVDALWADRLVHFEGNLRLGRGANYGPPRLVEHDAGWASAAERLMVRIRMVAGDRAVRLDHVGSTAVEGLPAKDIIDLQLVVADLAHADELADQLAAAGFILHPSVDADRPKPGTPADGWAKRYYRSADQGRPAHLHVRAEGSEGARFALLFRDWLRADDEARAGYGRFKATLAEEYRTDYDTERYAEAKEPWFDEAYQRANTWAEATGWVI